jgi:hypothetical protein
VRNRSMRVALMAAFAAVLSVMAVASASAAAAVTVTSVSPTSGPEFAATSVKIHGTGFSTTPGATTVTFGAEASSNVECKSSKVCVAQTPFEFEGTVPVTVTVGASSSSGSVTFTYTTYSPPNIEIVSGKKGAGFSKTKLTDRYPAIFTAGNVYLNITNATTTAQAFTGPSGPVTLEPGSTEGYNFPVDESSSYLFELTGSTSPKNKLTVKTKQPR